MSEWVTHPHDGGPLTDPPHGLPRNLRVELEGDHGFLFLNDYAIPAVKGEGPDGVLRFSLSDAEPEAVAQFKDWTAWAAWGPWEEPS